MALLHSTGPIGPAVTAALALVVAALTFGLRALPRRGLVYWGTDTWFHLKIADVMRTQGRVPDAVESFLIGDVYDYPPLLPRLLSYLPRALIEQYQWAVSPLADALQNALIFLFASWLWGTPLAGIVASAVFALTPIACSQSGELTPRCAGVLFVSIALSAAIIYSWFGQWIWAACAVVFVAATLLTHRMSTQALAWVSVLLSLSLGDARYLLILLAGLLLGTLASRGLYLRVLRGHLAELRFWRRNLQSRDEADPLKLLLGPRYSAQQRPTWRRLAVSAYSVIRHQPYIVLVPVVYSLQWQAEATITPLTYWIGFAYAAYLLTGWVPSLRFLGHNYRYLCYASLPISVISGGLITAVDTTPWFVGAIVAALSVIAVREYAGAWQAIRRNDDVAIDDGLREALRYIADLPGEGVVCVPIGRANAVAYFTGKKAVRHYSSQAMDRLVGYYPLVTRPLEEVADDFQCAYILLDERCTRGVPPDFPRARRILHTGPYHLFEVEPSTSSVHAAAVCGRESAAEMPITSAGLSAALPRDVSDRTPNGCPRRAPSSLLDIECFQPLPKHRDRDLP